MASSASGQHRQPGTGSAENKGQDRNEGVDQSRDMADADRQHMASEMGAHPSRLADLRDPGTLRVRGDAPGGSGEGRADEHTADPTDR